jgi:predicted transcriptional regulator
VLQLLVEVFDYLWFSAYYEAGDIIEHIVKQEDMKKRLERTFVNILINIQSYDLVNAIVTKIQRFSP